MHQYKCEYFDLEELFPPELMSLPDEYLWELMDENLLIVLDRLRIAIGKPIIINNWKTGGEFKWRGYRTNSCKIGAKKSPHKIGKGIDFDVKGMSAEEVRDYIVSHQKMFPEITRMEKDVNWVHVDCMPHKYKGLYLFNP
jgi:predicted small metal-binding protein